MRCKMAFFDDLKSSLHEAVDIKNGAKAPARMTQYEIDDVRIIREKVRTSQAETVKKPEADIDHQTN